VPSSKANSGGWQKRDEQRRRGKGETERGGNGETDEEGGEWGHDLLSGQSDANCLGYWGVYSWVQRVRGRAVRIRGNPVSKVDTDWQQEVLQRFNGRENLTKEEMYARFNCVVSKATRSSRMPP